MLVDCIACEDVPVAKKVAVLHKLDRRSESYRNAINDIMASNAKLTRQEAVKLFDDAYFNEDK